MAKAKTKGKKTAKAAKATAPSTTHTISEDGLTVTRHHADGDSPQTFSAPEAAAEYASSIPASE
jgi:hypothetical protein